MKFQLAPRKIALVRFTLACALFAALCAVGYFAPLGRTAAAQSTSGARRPTPVEAGAPVFPKFEDAASGEGPARGKSAKTPASQQAIITVESTGATGSVPTPTDNDYTRVANAVDALNAGDTIVFEGTFNWTEPNAAASWALGNDDTAATADDFSVLIPANINDVTLTATVLGDATFQGPGDLAAVNLEAVFVFDGGDNRNWTISNLRFLDFDLSIGLFGGAGGTDAFNDTEILDNYIRVPADLNATVAPADVNQNIGIHFAFGTNQRIAANTIEFPGDGVSVSASSSFAASVGMQSNTSGGAVYDGLLITGNTLRVLNAQSADPENILGIWENAHGHTSDIEVSDNQFLNQAAGNNSAVNLQRAFRVTSHSSATTTVIYTGNTAAGANIGFQWLASSNFAGNQPVRLSENTLTGNGTGVLVQSNGLANLYRNAITASGAGGGVNVAAGTLAAAGTVLNAVEENFISGGTGDGLRIAAGSTTGAVFNNDLGGNTGFGLNNLSASTIDASMNYWGTNTGAGVLAETNGPVDYNPFLDSGTDTAPATPGFQGDFSSLHADDNGAQTGSTGRIQEAVNRSTGANPIVTVEPGTYTEHVTVNKTVRLRGAQFGVDARDASRTGLTPTAAESIVNGPGGSFSLLANNIELDGFTIQGTTTGLPIGAGVYSSPSFSGYLIRNNIVQDNIIGVYLNGGAAVQTVFERNVVRDNDNPGAAGGTGVYSDQGLANAAIRLNRITGDNPTAGVNLSGASPVLVGIRNNEFLTGNQLVLFNVDNSMVGGNTFSGVLPEGGTGTGVFIGGGNNGLSVVANTFTDRGANAISASDQFGFGANSNLTITNNTVTQNASLLTANRSLISLNGVSGTSSVASNGVTLSGTLTSTLFVHGIDIQGATTGTIGVSGNTLNGGGVDAPDGTTDSSGIRLRLTAAAGTITLTNNTVSGFIDGVKADKIPLTITGGSYSSNEDDGLEFATGFQTTLSISGVSVTGNAGDGLLITNASQAGTLNISDLTLTGNGAGGQITNVSTFNFSPSTGANADVVTFNATQFQHTRDGSVQQAVLYSAVNALAVSTFGGTDSITHSAIGNHPGGLNIDGGAGTGDSFVIDDTTRTSATTYTINPTSVARTGTPGPVTANYSGLESLAVNGGSGSDTFNVTASPTTAISVDGNAAGDTLNYDAEGRPATRTPPTGPDGVITSPTVQPVTFFDIESVNISSTLQSLSVSDTVIAEPTTGSRNALFTVRLSAAETATVTVDFTTSDGTATAGQDYTATSGTLTFQPGQTVQTISVPVLADGPGEPDETFTVTLSNPSNAVVGDGTATGTITEGAQAEGIVMISELRTSGPLGATDEFVELYNNSNTTLTVAATDGSAGWGVYKMGTSCTDTPVLIATIPNGTNIPARGHFLLFGSNYSLADYGGTGAASGDLPFTVDIENDRNVGLFSTADVQNLASTARLDAVGFFPNMGNNCDLLSEGSTLQPAAGSVSEYSFARSLTTGRPLDTGNNASDFQVVSTTPETAVGSNATPLLGAPGPENDNSPTQRNASIKASPVDACVSSNTAPNRVRDTTPDPANNSAAGTLIIRRKFTNNTGGAVSRLRFRIVDITTFNSPGYTPGGPQADLRARSSAATTVTISVSCGGASVPVRGTTLEEPPAQPNGGGANSTLSVGAITLATPLAAGASTNVQFLLGVQQAGTFRFFINVEALPGGPPFAREQLNAEKGKSGDDKQPQP